jgi:hypothetical protein
MPAVADTLVTSRVVRTSDVSRRAASISAMELERRGSISDKGRRGEIGPHKDGEFVNYSSESDSDSSTDCRSVRSVRSNLSPQDVPRKALPSNSRFENSEAKSSESNKVRVADRGNDSTSEKERDKERERDRERDRERERTNMSKGEWDRIPQERETIRRRSENGNGILNSAAAALGIERAVGAIGRDREKERDDETTYVEEFR